MAKRAQIKVQKDIKPAVIDKFLGLNISNTGETQIQLGESGDMDNFYITNDYKLRKMYGYRNIYDFETPIKGMYTTNLGGVEYLLVATDGKLYYFTKDQLEGEIVGLEPTLIGNILDNEVSFFTFDKKVYILCGKYMSWDGTTLKEVEGYTPLVFINSKPEGGGVVYDEINMLSPKKHQTFNGDGVSTDFHIAQQGVTSIDKVLVDGEEKTITTDYTVDLTNGVVSFVGTAPQQAMDNVDIYWTLDDGDRHIIDGMKFGTVFGGDLDTRVFLYGNSECQNRTYFSGLEDGKPSVEYFPATAQVDVGPSNFALTDLTRQYDRLIATTNRPEAYYMTISTESLPITLSDATSTTRLVPSVGTFPLNEVHGNVAPGQGQLIDNYPVTIDRNAIIQWKASNVRDERNMEDISQKIRLDLITKDLRHFKTLDHQSENQLFVYHGELMYIYNYFNKTFSRIRTTDYMNYITDLNNRVYSGTNEGKVMQWGEEYTTYNGETINAHWEMNFESFGTSYLRKTMNRLWVLMQPQVWSSADIGYVTNRNESKTRKHIEYKILLMEDVDFANFSFSISRNTQPFRLKLKAKKFTNMKITIDNTENTDCTILELALKVESFGESK